MPPVALDAIVRSLAETESAGEIFNILSEGLAGVAPRGAIFLTRQQRLRGWSSFGYSPEAGRRQADFSAPLNSGRLGRVMSDASTEGDLARGGDPDFGQPVADQSFITTVAVKGQPIAAILAERDGDELPWDPTSIRVLCAFARLRLELTLAQRKLRLAEGGAAREVHAEAPGEAPVANDAQDSRASAGPQDAGLAPITAGEVTPDPVLAAARRFARLVATDIRLYNEEAVALGRQNRDLAERLLPSIKRGKATFVERHGDLGDTGLELLREAYVNVLAAGDANLLPTSLLK